jgi:Fe-S-cluster-containing hydrogenase component 2
VEEKWEMDKILFIDPEKCTGCRLCETACSLHHEKVVNPSLARIHVAKWETAGLYIPVVCVQCESPICQTVCPVKAISRDEKTGAVVIDSNVCVGCRLCALYCPFAGVQIDLKKGRVLKCDLCGGAPICAKFCDPQALQYVKATTANMMKQRAAAQKFSELMKKMLVSP